MNIDYNRINEIYNKFIVPKQDDSFLNRYKTLPIHLNDGSWRWEHKDFPRVVALLEFRKFIEESNLSFKKVLTFNGPGDPELSHISYEKIDNYNYLDDPSNLDLHTLDLPNKDYDFFMTNQTLEHVYDPCLALKNIHKHLNVGGIFYCNVPAFNMAHDTPHHHYVGFTPVGLGCIIEQAGFAKGFTLNGRAALSTKHTLAITNRGNATSADVSELADHIVAGVKAKFDIELKPEATFIS
jgi:SAM-dependent methyltransferase